MSTFAASLSPFPVVVIAVSIIAFAAGLLVLIRNRDAFARERGRLWMYHGEPDGGPHQMPGARDEDRHVVDPRAGVDLKRPERPVGKSGAPETKGAEPTSTRAPAGAVAGSPSRNGGDSPLDDLAAEWEQAAPPMDS